MSDEVLEERRKNWKPREPKVTSGYLAIQRSLVTSADREQCWKTADKKGLEEEGRFAYADDRRADYH